MLSANSKRYADWIRIVTLAMMALGVVMIYSAGARVDRSPRWFTGFADPASKQVIFMAIAMAALLAFSAIDYRRLSYHGQRLRHWPGFYLIILAMLLLAAVYVPGVGLKVKGAQRWIKVGPLSFQPSEFAKFALVIALAALLAWQAYPRPKFFKGLLPLGLISAIVCGLIGKEDLGTAVLIGLVASLLLLAGGVRLWHFLISVVPAAAIGFGYLVIYKPYRMERLKTFLDPWADPQGAGYHPIQSLIAIGHSGWRGMGLGNGIQKYGYLPEDTTDFIFSIICEELGLPGAILVIALIVTLVWSGRQISRRCGDNFGKLITLAVVSTIGLQAVINIAVATVSVPTKGIALPFVSAGGTSLLLFGAATALIVSVGVRGRAAPQQQIAS